LKYAFSQTRLNPEFLPKKIFVYFVMLSILEGNWGKGSQIKALVKKKVGFRAQIKCYQFNE